MCEIMKISHDFEIVNGIKTFFSRYKLGEATMYLVSGFLDEPSVFNYRKYVDDEQESHNHNVLKF